MSEGAGTYYDGKCSARREVTVSFDADGIRIRGAEIDLYYPPRDVAPSPKVAAVRRTVHFRSGALCEIHDGSLLEEWLARQGKGGGHRLLHRFETRLRYVLPALALTVAAVFVLIQNGIPWLARRAAFALPAATEDLLGRQTMRILDRAVFSPSELPAGRREEIGRLFRRMTAGLPDAGRYRIEFRASRTIGPNALALPPRIVVLTDGLVLLARHDEEIAAVLAHEVGHIRHRHVLRQVLQDSAGVLLIAALSGDIVSTSSLAAALPSAVVHAKFSRDFEREADDAALSWLKENRIPPTRFADLLRRMDADRKERQGIAAGRGGSAAADFLSTHPDLEERIRKSR